MPSAAATGAKRTVDRRTWAPPSPATSCACLDKCKPFHPLTLKGALLYPPMTAEQGGDWLADGQPGEVDRGGQTLEQWRANSWPQHLPQPPPPNRRRRKTDPTCKIYLVPLGNLGDLDVDALCTCVRAFYHGATVEILPAVATKKLLASTKSRSGDGVHGKQLETHGCHKLLQTLKPNDAFVVVGLTLFDLYPRDDWAFVYGEANASRGSGVFSFARYGSPDLDPKTFLRRAMWVLCHETGHLFGLSHCIWWKCTMNGTNGGGEGGGLERMPMHLCPMDLAKLHDALAFDVVERERALEALWTSHGFDEDARFSQQLLDEWTGGGAKAQAAAGDQARVATAPAAAVCQPCVGTKSASAAPAAAPSPPSPSSATGSSSLSPSSGSPLARQ